MNDNGEDCVLRVDAGEIIPGHTETKQAPYLEPSTTPRLSGPAERSITGSPLFTPPDTPTHLPSPFKAHWPVGSSPDESTPVRHTSANEAHPPMPSVTNGPFWLAGDEQRASGAHELTTIACTQAYPPIASTPSQHILG
ncbi:hypothetical protein AX17_002637 [Amanita inopinata Kibby_2008]|nr:hypothetical protein AX17_002637 [Amanita inopinata Kibby_2008]